MLRRATNGFRLVSWFFCRMDYVDGTHALDHITQFQYDFRDRLTTTTQFLTESGTSTILTVNTYDNLNHVTETQQYGNSVSNANLIRQRVTNYDNLGRVFNTMNYAIIIGTGPSSIALQSNTWFDPAGNVAKSQPAGSQAYTKNVYDSVGRQTASYVGYAISGSDTTPFAVGGNDKIFEQSLTTYDDASHVVQTAAYQRWDANFTSDTGGPLNGPDQSAPNARVSFMAIWYDGVGRQIATANYGTNGNTSILSAPASAPVSSASVLVSQSLYNERSEAFLSIDPAGKIMRTDADDAGRTIRTTDNYVPLGSCASCGSTTPCGCALPGPWPLTPVPAAIKT